MPCSINCTLCHLFSLHQYGHSYVVLSLRFNARNLETLTPRHPVPSASSSSIFCSSMHPVCGIMRRKARRRGEQSCLTSLVWVCCFESFKSCLCVIFILAYVPSKLQLLRLDVFIIFLQMVLTTIAYEASLFESSAEPDTHDMLLPIPDSPMLSPAPLSESTSRYSTPLSAIISEHTKSYFPTSASQYVIDLRIAPIIARLRNPPPPPRAATSDTSLPLPNTTPWHFPRGMRMLMRGSQTRREGGGTVGSSDGSSGGRIPGGLTERE